MSKENKNKHLSLLKLIGGSILVGAIIVSVDYYNVVDRIANFYNCGKAKIIDVIHYDTSERADDLINNIRNDLDLKDDYAKLEETVNAITDILPEQYRLNLINNLSDGISIDAKYGLLIQEFSELDDPAATNIIKNKIPDLDDFYKQQIMTDVTKEVLKKEKQKIYDKVQQFYDSIKTTFSGN